MGRQITSDPVRVISATGKQLGIMPLREARHIAASSGVDLVEIAPKAEPPVCRVMDYGKYLYDLGKKRQEARRKQKHIVIKEVKFRPGTGAADYAIKLRNVTRFIDAGNKVKVTMRFRGREMAHRNLGLEVLQQVERDAAEIAAVEQMPLMEGRQMIMVLAPKKKG